MAPPPRPPLTTSRPGSGKWLTINEACLFLGVDQSTLRRWSDAGKIPVFRTPGGHRRYAEEDLRVFVGGAPRRTERPRVNRRELTDRSLSAYEEAFWRGARERSWFAAYASGKQDEFRLNGRRLVDLAVRYASAPTTSDRTAFLEEGRLIGVGYGQFAAGAGMTAAEAVEAFLYFRMPVVRSVAALIEEHGLAAKRSARLFGEIGQFLDQILIAFMHAHAADSPSEPSDGAEGEAGS